MSFRNTQVSSSLLLLVAILLTTALPMSVHAEEASSPEVANVQATTIDQVDDGVHIEWNIEGNEVRSDSDVSAASVLSTLSTLRYGGYDLPVKLLYFQADGTAGQPLLTIERNDAAEWNGELTPAKELIPPVVDWEPSERMLNSTEERVLPTEPVFIHSTGRLRGREIHVVAVSPIYEEDGTVKMAQGIEARMRGVTPVEGNVADLLLTDGVQASNANVPFFADASQLAPTNAAAAINSVKLIAEERGIQQVAAAALKAAGLNLSDIERLALAYNGQPVPLEIQDANENGRLDVDGSDSEFIRFYAPGVGDYWNSEEVYWLSVSGLEPTRMIQRNVAAASAPQTLTAYQQGIWRDNKTYEPEWGGLDEDHWFASRMAVAPDMQGKPNEYPRLTADLDISLPLATGRSVITPSLTLVQQVAEYELDVIAGNRTETAKLKPQDAVNLVDGNWQPTLEYTNLFSSLEVVLIPTDSWGTLLVDSVEWSVPVTLSFGRKGEIFSGLAGIWRYTLSNLSAGVNIYDITNPFEPVRLTGIKNGEFQDGPEPRVYLATGPGTVHAPRIEKHTPVVFDTSRGADALYIAPSVFIDGLTPLVDHRRAQGYQVSVIDVQDIYDAWGYGHVGPESIRHFLRFAVQEWNPSPVSAVLVSDGTRDPFNYENKESNINFIPPYLIPSFIDRNGQERPLDPFWGQNGCENCFGQLDGDDPLNNDIETPGTGFMPDIWIGRLPAKNTADVTAIVNKIIRYETSTAESKTWRSKALFLADNYYYADGSIDKAGDFVMFSEEAIRQLPSGIRAERLYYDPTAEIDDPWRESNSVAMREQAVELMGQGFGLVTYNGHSAHWLWARTSDCAIPLKVGEVCPPDQKNPDPFIFGLYDNDRLLNLDQLHVGLSMTCFTSQFFEPANSGTVLDERTVVHPAGGAVAVWGPAGLSVATGHDDLQYGFHDQLWTLTEQNPGSARIGQLIEAGYVENMAPSCDERNPDKPEECYACCDDVRRTFLLLGDPLTPVQMSQDRDLFLPVISR